MDKRIAITDKELIWHPYTRNRSAELNLTIVKAKGSYLYDENGEKYIDAVGSWWVNLHGHGHPAIVKAIAKQAATIDHIMFAGFTHAPAVNLAKALINILPPYFDKVFYSDNGSTAVEVALKMCFQYWSNKGQSRKKVIALENSYHGDTFGAMSVGAKSIFTKAFDPFLFEVVFIIAEKEEESIVNFEQMVSANDVACFIFEPIVQGAAGMKIYNAEWLSKLIQIANNYQVPCIADEVFTGFGRTGKLFAIEHLTGEVDIICLSKGLTGGVLPLGATLCRAEIFNAFKEVESLPSDGEGLNLRTFFHGHSFTANPIACAAALASINLLSKPDCKLDRIRIAKMHEAFVRKVLKRNSGKIIGATSIGVILVVEYATDEQTGYLNKIRDSLYEYFLSKGIVMRPLGNIVYMVPPYCITNAELKKVYLAIEEFES